MHDETVKMPIFADKADAFGDGIRSASWFQYSTVDDNRTACILRPTGDAIGNLRLSRTCQTSQPFDLPGLDIETDILDQAPAAQIPDFQHWRSVQPGSARPPSCRGAYFCLADHRRHDVRLVQVGHGAG
ncbi:hypothetical protein D3C78_1175030 [compost metagenome]